VATAKACGTCGSVQKKREQNMSLRKVFFLYFVVAIFMIGGVPKIGKASIGAEIVDAGSNLTFDLGVKAIPGSAPFKLSFLMHFKRLEETSTPEIHVEIAGAEMKLASDDYILNMESPFSPSHFVFDYRFPGSTISTVFKNGDVPFRMTNLVLDFENAEGHSIRRSFTPVTSVVSMPSSITLALTALVYCFAVFRVARRRSTYGAAV
jgi:hypothetical protein